jgi:hypothetical protein
MINLSFSLADLKQREMDSVAAQRAKIHETGALPLLDSPFAAELFNCLPPASQRPGDASSTTPNRPLESIQVNAIAVSHERRFIQHLHASHQEPRVEPLVLAKHVEC